MWKKVRPALGFSAIALAAGGLSGVISAKSMESYAGLLQPPLAPPGWVFPVMWTILYILMGISAGIVWRKGVGQARRQALWSWAAQLFFNFWWTLIFFNLQWRLFAFFWLLALLVLVVSMISRFSRISETAANLNVPYLVWLCFAAYLNMGVYILNG